MGNAHPAVAVLRDLLGDRALVVVSNREPYVHRRTADGVSIERPAGGLVAALDPVVAASGGTWIAWGSGDADFEVTDAHGRIAVPPDTPAYTLRRIRLTPAEVDGYYYGYANQALWPLCHMATEHARFRRRAWEMYRSANHRFSEAVLAEAPQGSLIWVHDYHLALVPRAVRAQRSDQFLMHFWHIPWPAWDIFRLCPQRVELLDGLLGSDLMVFQHPRHAEHFLECAQRELGAVVDRDEGWVEHAGRVTHVEAFPISVDFAVLSALAQSRECAAWMGRLRRRYRLEGRIVALGVDRLDYTKGIPERLRALDRLFERFPEYRGRLVFIQKSATSRTQIKAYRDLQRHVADGIARLNATYGTPDWQPVIHLPRPLPPAGLAALYRMAALCAVTSLQDGMNLVAKEYIACQGDRSAPGVLVLSELAGAREELTWAVPINPHDATGCAEAFVQALRLPLAERQARMSRLRAHVSEYDIYHWMELHLRAAARLLAAQSETRWVRTHLKEIQQRLSGRKALGVLLDFDGTLAPIVATPEQAALPEDVRTTLERLTAVPGVLVAVLSGRSLDDIRTRVGIDGLVYGGNHGLEIAAPEWTWTHPQAEAARHLITEACARLRRRLRSVRGVVIEDKGLTAGIHYRQVSHPELALVRMAVYEEAGEALTVHRGKQVFELHPHVTWDKGAAAREILRRVFGEQWNEDVGVIYLGDDRTDEDAFLALADEAVTVRVGAGLSPTAARYAAGDVAEVVEFLRWISEVARPSGRGARSDRG